ncbi:MAG: hypothetical protein ACLPTF_22830 [Steroidobacteraceae bacterium]
MALMTPATHSFVDLKLRKAADVIEESQRVPPLQTGHMNFEAALRILYECRTLIDAETDVDKVVGHLETAAVELGELDSGNAPCVRTAIRAIADMVDELKAQEG